MVNLQKCSRQLVLNRLSFKKHAFMLKNIIFYLYYLTVSGSYLLGQNGTCKSKLFYCLNHNYIIKLLTTLKLA